MSSYPYRVRLYGGRRVHAAGHRAGFADRVTTCNHGTGPGDDWRDDTDEVTCRACIKILGETPP